MILLVSKLYFDKNDKKRSFYFVNFSNNDIKEIKEMMKSLKLKFLSLSVC